MAVELMNGYTSSSFFTKMEESGVYEAATAGLQSVENLIRLISQSQQQQSQNLSPTPTTDYKPFADVAVTKFKKLISLLDRNRTGHARFRRGPVSDPPQHQKTSNERETYVGGSKVYCPVPIQQLPPLPHNHLIKHGLNHNKEPTTTTITFGQSASMHENSFLSSLTGDIRPPSFKRKCSSTHDSTNVKCSGSSGKCHCHKKRKSRIKRVERVAAISLKMSDIPPDDFSWRKYGQKPIKGSPHPRGYYKCSSVKGCPARKHVERDLQDPTMLIVTYEDQHNHPQSPSLLLKSS